MEADLPAPVIKKELPQGGILKRPLALQPEQAVKVASPRTVEIPVTVLDKSESRLVTKSEDNKRMVIVEKFQKVTEERRVNGRVEASSTEERHSVDRSTPDMDFSTQNRPSSSVALPKSILSPVQKIAVSQDQHYRDPSDGGYSSGRSDPGANVRTWLNQHPSTTLPGLVADTRDYQVAVENCPPRPPIPTEFRPPVYTSPVKQEAYQAQYASKPAPLAPGRMQPKTEPAKKAALSSVDVQKHWLVQEAEMRRLTDADTRQRNAMVAPPLPIRSSMMPSPQAQSHDMMPSMPAYGDMGYRLETSSLGRQQSGISTTKHGDPYSSINRNMTDAHDRFEEDRYIHTADPQIRTVVRSIGPVSHGPQPIVHRPNQPPYSQPYYQKPETVKYPTAHIPAHLSHVSLQQKQAPKANNYYSPDPVVSQSVPNVLLNQQPKPSSHNGMSKPQSNPAPAFNPGNVAFPSISSKWRCACCGEILGGDPAMIVENLKLVYHVACFKCVVCGQRLSDGSEGADVKVRNGRLHCDACLSDESMHMTQL